MKILMVGDIFGRAGRRTFAEYTPKLKSEKNIDIVIANGENAAHGHGLTVSTFNELLSGGADIITTGNHVWSNKDILSIIDREPFLIRPANYPEGTPGNGFCIFPYRSKNIGVINILGRTFMQPIDCPFVCAEKIVAQIKNQCDIILVDFHAEATSEKISMGYFLDGKVTAVVGTHTHVQTADERILPNGTAYITDLGMVGILNSVIGLDIDCVVEKFLTCIQGKLVVPEKGACIYSAALLEIDDSANKIKNIERISIIEN
ncbi:MAG: TIGR00282 family metallophosphoesterase [Selenomonadaceae bacterium]|nr:TIGR00282 family metallophosphoesterase [Selenomonadaceae bacterium]